ncbi:monooxygenase FAD-binding protein [Monoraphidium neglectum]|uniref:Monooxygenase FAD-binding protein n=1 Tax=Monoraphidium neglectum TaxID=145388 RepID=A0A0D2JTU6_9CHLO|nr:monooxygenase FAD-binding protein [Monoraphidium neglectum]KIZ02343.1 monooxygenase FAD-binding protein [Monoraphidium neglectum]|eukprot:XP_013901362.1 monooxygenase FAD-binding protein [Monoraphidium neglectum]
MQGLQKHSSGLVAAQRLSKHFDEVVCLERDPLGGDRDAKTLPTKRPGVPQFKHAHGLLGRGGSILDDSFGPDYRSELLAAGGRLVDWHSDLVIHALPGTTFMRDAPGSAPPPGRPPMYMYSATRGLIEGTARKLLERNPKVTVRYGARADGLAFSADKDDGGRPAAVEGVTLAGGGGVVGADLVVDCSGRNSRVADWLGAAGWEAPPVSVVDAGVGYVSRHVRLTLEAQRRLEGIELIAGLPLYPNPQFALMQRMEGGEFMVAMAGFAQDEAAGSPPMVDDVAAINAWGQGVWWPEFNELLCGATALGPPSRFFNLNNVHRRYDAVALPEGLALLGDTVCSFNPVYGQER